MHAIRMLKDHQESVQELFHRFEATGTSTEWTADG